MSFKSDEQRRAVMAILGMKGKPKKRRLRLNVIEHHLWKNRHHILGRTPKGQGIRMFEWPDYGGLPGHLTKRFTPDDVDMIQQVIEGENRPKGLWDENHALLRRRHLRQDLRALSYIRGIPYRRRKKQR